MKKVFIFLLTATILMGSICTTALAAYDGDSKTLYRTDTTAKESAYCWTDLTYSTSSNKVKADCWITYKNSYPHIFHNCVELNTFTSTDRWTGFDYSDSARNVIVTKEVASNFTWCYASHGVNACGRVNLSIHSYNRDSGSDYAILFTTIRVN